ncbi:aldose 1-epimerase family protein [Olsenella uli]|uniref:aldose 1-epimerase family protein n=1 Tax=Olsenella uli TaxID=133926 RepID=UPI00241D79E8|nr:aldose 1-epimerase family protein [Olsenella uli]
MDTHDVAGNAGIRIEVSPLGAQLMSLKVGDGEFLWQGDGRWWPRRAPVLFPIVGNIRDGQAESAQGRISLGRHGLARNHTFALERRDSASLSYVLSSSKETRRQYPYDFDLRVSYSVVEGGVRQEFLVTNTGDETLPYVVGGHPAFNVPAPGPEASAANEDFSQYRLEFSRPWTYATPSIDTRSGLLDFDGRIDLLDASDTLLLSHQLFSIDTLVFEDVPDRTVRLVGPRGHGMRVDFEGFDYLGVWSAAGGAPFVALEPWTGCATALDEDDVFERKRGMSLLAPGQTQAHAFVMRPL